MSLIFDWILIIITTLITYKSYKRVIFNKKSSVAYLVICVIYVFCCIPIVLNYLVGIPTYSVIYWYRSFKEGMHNTNVAIIYDVYILLSVILLYYYAVKRTKKLIKKNVIEYEQKENNNTFIYIIGILSPLFYAIITGNITKLLTYNSMSGRGVEPIQGTIINSLILLSLYFSCVLFLKGNITARKLILLAFVSFVLSWMQGKRFIIAVIAIFNLFFLSKSEMGEKGRKILYKTIPIAGVLLIVFSIFYLAILKPLSTMAVESVYDMLRVDYGRDDVIKFVINEEFFKKNHILEYPGQSFFSTMLIFIPRFLWPSKPYSHYQYLTSAILDLPINKLPAGTTPCWYEMCLCNFGYWGFIIAILGLILFCSLADKMRLIKSKALVFMLILVLLTQNTDVYIVYIFMIFIYFLLQNIKHPKFVWGRKNVS